MIIIRPGNYAYLTPPPFSSALRGEKKKNDDSLILEVLKQVTTTYAKFLKDLCTVKKGLNIKKKAFLIEQVSAIIEKKSLLSIKI